METTLAIPRKQRFYTSIVLGLLEKMPLGTLQLTLPGGETLTFGNGEGIAAEVSIKSEDFFRKAVLYGDIGFGEAYVDGDWNTPDITKVISWFLLNVEHAPSVSGSKQKTFMLNLLKFFNWLKHLNRANSIEGSRKNISEHYDLNNDFFSLFLDPTMTYSSGYFETENTSLREAQEEKYDRLCRKLKLKPADHVLEIGSGWGGNAIYMAKNYGCKVTTVTISEEQYKLAKEKIEKEGLSERIDLRLSDYRHIEGKFDKIVSIEMLEAVGHGFLEAYFKKCHELLKKDGALALQVITCPDPRYDSLRKGVDWIQKHIFPGSLLPSVGAINKAINNTGDMTLFNLEDMGLHYARTLSIWRKNFNMTLDKVRELGFSDAFIRKWNYYLCYCEAAFAMRNINVMQIVYTRPNNLNL
jgi:cyclopropane-fatty-acyl-phospholipid synthase